MRRVQSIAADGPRPGQSADPREHVFDWQAIIDPLKGASKSSPQERHARVLHHLRTDISRAEQGNLDDPVKSAVDGAFRDLRSTIRYGVEFGGLTARSHAQFVHLYSRIINRIAVGTSMEIMRKILALAECGFLDLSASRTPSVTPRAEGGYLISSDDDLKSAMVADVFVEARVHRFHVHRMRNPLFANLCRRKLIRDWVNPGTREADFHTGGLDIQRGTHLIIMEDGKVSRGMAALGPPTEGPLYFHLAAMRPYCSDPVIVDADRVVRCILDKASHSAGKAAGDSCNSTSVRGNA